jgi:hypothetical protein
MLLRPVANGIDSRPDRRKTLRKDSREINGKGEGLPWNEGRAARLRCEMQRDETDFAGMHYRCERRLREVPV